MSIWFLCILQIAVIAYAVVAGVFLAFSDFIMRSLAHMKGTGGVEAMQVINREVFRWVFMGLFLGMVPMSLVIGIYGLVVVGGLAGGLMASAALIYALGCFGITLCFNVPMNEALSRMELGLDATQNYWTGTYLPRWTFWNSVRTLCSALSSGLLLVALFLLQHAFPS